MQSIKTTITIIERYMHAARKPHGMINEIEIMCAHHGVLCICVCLYSCPTVPFLLFFYFSPLHPDDPFQNFEFNVALDLATELHFLLQNKKLGIRWSFKKLIKSNGCYIIRMKRKKKTKLYWILFFSKSFWQMRSISRLCCFDICWHIMFRLHLMIL